MVAKFLAFLSAAVLLSGCSLFERRSTKKTDHPETDTSWVERLESQRELSNDKIRSDISKAERKRRGGSGDWEDDLGPLASEKRALKKARVIPTVKLKPQPEEIDEIAEDDVAPPDEGQTVADSSHELMHGYFEGVERLRAGQLDRALVAFRGFLEQNPDHPYADRALAHMAAAHERAGEWTAVIQATTRLENGYHYSFLIPEALYRRAGAYAALKETAKARETWRTLLRRYPNEPEAERASRRLAEIGNVLPSLPVRVSERPRRPPLLIRDIPKN